MLIDYLLFKITFFVNANKKLDFLFKVDFLYKVNFNLKSTKFSFNRGNKKYQNPRNKRNKTTHQFSNFKNKQNTMSRLSTKNKTKMHLVYLLRKRKTF